MVDIPPRVRFAEEIRKLIKERTRNQDAVAVGRREVEEIGRSLGMTEVEACKEFFRFRGSLWDVRTGSMIRSLIRASDDPVDPPRSWSALNDVILLGP